MFDRSDWGHWGCVDEGGADVCFDTGLVAICIYLFDDRGLRNLWLMGGVCSYFFG